jgi:ATP-dependent Clp protease ATP-binding subunit ClpA
MKMIAFDKYFRTIVDEAGHEAKKDGSPTFEAQHLLLAIATARERTTHRLLTAVGLDHQKIRDALDREFQHSLSAAGVSLAASDLPRPSYAPAHPSPGASAKLALERSFTSVARKRDLRPAHLLLGITRAEIGTVPRALALAGIDQADLRARIVEALASESE